MITQFEPKIISQHIDTLVTAHKSRNLNDYNHFFLKIGVLEDAKYNAQAINGDASARFVIIDNLFGFGRFKVFATGGGVYRYRIANDDFTALIGALPFGSDRGQISIRYNQSFLVTAGYKKAYELVSAFVDYLLGDCLDLVSEIHLATDVWGIRYERLDPFRFQTNFKASEYAKSGFIDETLNVQVVSKKQLETITFGRNAFMFRIYDKLKELKRKPVDLAIIEPRWIINGYNPDKKAPVWRHEIQLRDTHLKKHFSPDCTNQVLDAFDKLSSLWAYALSKITYVPLNENEVVRIANSDNSDTVRQIFFRAKKENRYNEFDILKTWRNDIAEIGTTYKNISEAKRKTAIKYAKAFISSTYKACDGDFRDVADILAEASATLYKYDGVTLHQYGALKVVDSFLKNERFITSTGAIPPANFDLSFVKAQRYYFDVLNNIADPDNSVLKRFEKFINKDVA